MSNYISKIEQAGIEYAIRDEALSANEVLVNGEVMPSFMEALTAAHGELEIKLLNNIVINKPINVPAGANVVLDLNGHSITPSEDLSYSGGMITVVHGASLTINGEGTVGGYAPNLMAVLQLTNKDFMNDANPANLIINGGHYIGKNYCICGNGNPGRGNTKVIINGGIFDTYSNDSSVIYNPQENSSIIINGGKLIGANTGIEMRSGDLTINGGYIESLNAPASVTANGNGTTAVGSAVAICQHTTKKSINVVINDGIMKGYHAFYQANPQKNEEEAIALIQLTINNGSFIANYGSSLPVYSENKIGFVKGGSFSPALDEKYRA